jgi:hypothetical protein
MGKQVSNRHQKNQLLGHARIGFLYKSTRFNRTLLMIFISVAAFCDPFLEHRLMDAMAKAKNPEQLVFAVVDQTPVTVKTN